MGRKKITINLLRHKKNTKKPQTNKILDRLTFTPKKHKQKTRRKLRQQPQEKKPPTPKPSSPTITLKFGSFNINGMDLETSWAVEELLRTCGFDVRPLLVI